MKKKIKARLNELTYRQYMALVYIVSKLDIEGEHAQKRGIKEVIGFDSDRMLQITLEALERKGFITFHGLDRNPLAEITEETEKNLSILSDRLLLSDEYVEYNDVKKQTLPITETKNHFKVTAPSFIDNDSLGYLNNSKRMVHRWSDFLEDYPPSLVWDKINEYGVTSANTVLDPFMGSGTTLVTAKLRNINAIGIDVNPVANFVTEVKTTWGVDLKKFKTEANAVISSLIEASPILDDVRMTTESLKNMDTMELHQWLKPRTQNDVAFTRERINEVEDERIKKLLLLALIVASRDASNVSFCPGTSFYPFRERPTFLDAFKNKCKEIYEDLLILAKINKNYGETTIFNADSRNLSTYIEPNSVDFILTSPPYPNDLEYTRQTRLELYLLGYVKNMKDVTEIKKSMVKGSTKLIYQDSSSAKYVEKFESVQEIVDALEKAFSDKKWGWDYPRMVKEYFGDIYIVLENVGEVLKEGGYALFVVGDQTYKKILIPVGEIMMELVQDLGFHSQRLETFRVRRSTLHSIPLKEEIVIFQK
ncbi:hypothetical protein CW713_05945 [Methanophagales archaeon]|nr:MAG: hypothetical protein CW714_03095 [Methanophagales archaeon]RJS81769.1 MAG: hypothetical protein CW713_05945 [Methanophagales archaeon]